MKDFQSLQRCLEEKQEISARRFCDIMFPTVSRTFAVNVGKLPSELSFQVLISYLLCRIADTVEDDPGLLPKTKDSLLKKFTQLLTDPQGVKNCQEFNQACQKLSKTGPDAILTQNSHYVLECFFEFPPEIQEHITEWVTELALGMGLYALRKDQEKSQVTFLYSMDDLEDYCYYVAGTVGHLLTGLFRHHYPCINDSLGEELTKHSTSFGLGLQLTNIVKDSVVDYHRGWCYLPGDLLSEMDLAQGGFLDLDNRRASQELMYKIVVRAKEHLDNALEYSCLLPRKAYKVRLFCFLPLMMAIKSLEEAVFSERLFCLENPVKISRQEVVRIVQYGYVYGWSNLRMRRWYGKVCSSLESKVEFYQYSTRKS